MAADRVVPPLPVGVLDPCVHAVRCGDLDAAAGQVAVILRDFPQHPDVHHLAGFIALRRHLYADAARHCADALSLQPDHTAALVHAGHALRALDRHQAALESYDHALRLDPVHLDALHGRGHALAALNRSWEAIEGYSQAIAAEPGFLDAYVGKGNVLVALDRLDEAIACYDQALTRADKAGDRAPRDVVAHLHYFRADALSRQERFDAALAGYERALELFPDYHEALLGCGRALTELRDHLDALDCFERACRVRPDDLRSHDYRSRSLRELGRWDEALAAAERAVALGADDTGALTALAHTLRGLARLDEAEAAYAKAASIKPDLGPLTFNHAICLLLKGDYARGWPNYEARWTTEKLSARRMSFPQPVWLGQEDIAGQRILLYAEQGHGDTIQFCRYAPMVRALGAEVVLGVQPPLRSLLNSLNGVAEVVDRTEAMPIFDRHCPLMSLPLAFGTRLETVPNRVPYLWAPVGQRAVWQERLGPRPGPRQAPRIGIAWSGNARHQNDQNRSVPLETLQPLLALPAGFHCLQRDLRPGDLPAFAMCGNLTFFGGDLLDFADTAAMISQLDLVIAVDTAVAHLAGAMGWPVWVMLPFAPDWRWLQQGEATPWYPTARLFRQDAPGDWSGVIRKLCAALQVWLANRSMVDHASPATGDES